MGKNFVLFMLFPNPLESDQHTGVIKCQLLEFHIIKIMICLAPYSFLSL